MSGLEDLVALIPIDQVANRLGVDPAQADALVKRALPTLVAGMQANAQDAGGASSLAEALGQHDPSLVDGGVDLDQVDEGDGQKILGHVFGANQGSVIQQLGALGGGADEGIMAKLLPLLAPVVMSWLAKDLLGGDDSPLGDLGLGDLGGLGGGSGSGGLSDVLGGLLANELDGGSELDQVLGGLLGGGTR
jgi:hypothetical protein